MSIKPITATLALLQGGTFLDACSEQMNALVKGVDETGKADAGTTERMKLFDKFSIGIPVFWSPPGAETVTAFPVVARLRYRLNAGKVVFWYDLVRADLVHQKAATTLIAQIRAELGETPMLLGACA